MFGSSKTTRAHTLQSFTLQDVVTVACGVVKNNGVDFFFFGDSQNTVGKERIGNILVDLVLVEEQIVCSFDFDLPVSRIWEETVEAVLAPTYLV